MRVLNVIATMDPVSGGPCQGLRNSIPVQHELKVENEVVCFDNPSESFLHLEKNFKIHAIGPPKGPYSYCRKLSNWLTEHINRFDVIVIHGLWLYHSFGTFNIWRTYKHKNKKAPKLFVMPHGMLDPYFQRAKSRRLKAVRNWIFWNLIENKVVNKSDGVLFTCREELELAKQTFSLYKPSNELNAGFGIPEPPAKNIKTLWTFLKKCPRLKDNSYWLFLSRIHPKKGVDLLIKAYVRLKLLQDNIPDLVIAGPGLETPYGQQVKKLAKGLPIHFPGMLKGKAKWSAFYYSDVFVLPSHQENFGIAIVEAMSCGKPVLITNQVNIWREVKEGNAGIISNDTEDDIFSMLHQWHNLNNYQKNRLGMNAYTVYKEKFSVRNAAKKFIGCISNESSINTDVSVGTV